MCDMQPTVTPAAPVRRPSPEADRPRPVWAALAAVGGLGVGLALVAATLSPAPTPPPDPGPVSAAAPSEPEIAAPAKAPPELEPPPELEAPPELEEPPAAPEPPRPAAPKPPPPAAEAPQPPTPRPTAGGARIVPGRVAYLQCDGVPPQDGPYPCPRDVPLEDAAWAVLATLSECPRAPAGPGAADVRLHFQGAGPPEVRVLARATDLDVSALLACLREPLTALTTTLAPDRMVISFRFRQEAP
jgi:hypothetical protein